MPHESVKLGKLPPQHDARTLRLAKYVTSSALPTPPTETARAETRQTALQMYGNDSLGDCTCAGVGNLTQFWASLGGVETPLTDDQVLDAYEQICGYKPGDPSTDQGGIELNILRAWRKAGIGGHKIDAFASVDLSDEDLLKAAVYLFDGLYVGVQLPVTAQNQDVWDYDATAGTAAFPGSWGGHCIDLVDYNATGPVYATWGALKQATWKWQEMYCDEAWAVISRDQMNASGKSFEGFNLDQLTTDLAAVNG